MTALMALLMVTATTLTASELPRQCELHTNGAAPQRVELYTSEGCSSCPPADRWLSALPVSADRIVLAFHVDYWNDLGWPDRFADRRFSQRQRQMASRWHNRTVYTPAVVVEGAEFRAWRSRQPAVNTGGGGELSARLALTRGQVTVDLNAASSYPATATAHLALTEDALFSEVHAGENRGLKLRHDHVVRAYAGPSALDQSLQVAVPTDLDPSRARWVVWVEDSDGRTLQALSSPLDSCATTLTSSLSDIPN